MSRYVSDIAWFYLFVASIAGKYSFSFVLYCQLFPCKLFIFQFTRTAVSCSVILLDFFDFPKTPPIFLWLNVLLVLIKTRPTYKKILNVLLYQLTIRRLLQNTQSLVYIFVYTISHPRKLPSVENMQGQGFTRYYSEIVIKSQQHNFSMTEVDCHLFPNHSFSTWHSFVLESRPSACPSNCHLRWCQG